MAQRIVDMVAKKINANNGIKIPECSTQNIKLSGGKINETDLSDFIKNKTLEGNNLSLSSKETETLVYRFGSNVDEVFKIISSHKENYKNELPLFIFAQLHYCVEKEMCTTPSDFFIRRTGALYFDVESVKQLYYPVTLYMLRLFGWTDQVTKKYLQEIQVNLSEIDALKK